MSVDLLMTQAKDTASQMALRDCSEDVKGEPRYSFCQKKKKKQQQQQQNRQQDIKTLLLIQENQILQANECSAFLFHGKYESLGL